MKIKAGETRYLVRKIKTEKSYDNVRFRLTNKKNTIEKSTDAEAVKDKVIVQDGVFLIPLQQQDTADLVGSVTIEAEIDYQDKSVRYTDYNAVYVNESLGWEQITGSKPSDDDGIEPVMEAIEQGIYIIVGPESSQELIDAVTDLFQDTKDIAQSVRDDADNGEFDGYSPQVTVKTETPSTYVLHIKDADHEYDTPNLQGQGEGGTSDYEDLSNKPRINNIELIGNKTDTDLGLATKTELNAKQNVISGGNGIDVSSDVVSVDNGAFMKFINSQLTIDEQTLGFSLGLRNYLANTGYQDPLASKTYVDNLVSGRLKRLVVETLPTQDIDTNTIYMILKSAPTTNNIYDEYMYINNAWELIGSTEVDLSNYYTKTESDNRYNAKLTVGNGIDITNDEISIDISSGSIIDFFNGKLRLLGSQVANDSDFQSSMPYITTIRQALLTPFGDYNFQPKLTAGTNITIVDNVISASGGSYSGGDGIDITNDTISVDLKSGSKLQFDNGELDVDLSSKQDTIDTTHKLSADLVDDTNTTNKFVTSTDKQTWNAKADTSDIPTNVSELQNDSGYQTSSDVQSAIADKEDKTTISTDTTSTTVSLTLADNHEYRYTQDLTSLTLTMPSGDFIASIVFASGSTPTSMTYDSNIKWSGDDVTGGQFVPTEKTYNIVMWYNGLSINAVVRGVA